MTRNQAKIFGYPAGVSFAINDSSNQAGNQTRLIQGSCRNPQAAGSGK
jgi:hypothetical protein